jgi:hypothetical protein
MTEIVEAEVIKPRPLSGGDELLGDPVRLPRLGARGIHREHEASSTLSGQFAATSSRRARSNCRLAESSATRWDRRVLVGASTGPSGPSNKPAGTTGWRGRSRRLATAAPAADLAWPRSWGGEDQKQVEKRLTERDVFEQAVDFFGSRRAHLHRFDARRGRVRRRVRPDPLPTHRLGQSPMKDAVHPSHRARRQRLSVLATVDAQRGVELVDHDGGQLAH